MNFELAVPPSFLPLLSRVSDDGEFITGKKGCQSQEGTRKNPRKRVAFEFASLMV